MEEVKKNKKILYHFCNS